MTLHAAQILRRFSFDEWGGTENVVWNSAQALRSHDVQSEILCTRALCAVPEEEKDGLRIRRFPYFYPYFPLFSAKKLTLDKKGGNPFCFPLWKYLNEKEFDLYHIHAPGRLSEVVRRVARKRGKPYLISFHGGCCDVPAGEMSEMLSPLKHTFPYGGILDRLLRLRADTVAGASAILCVGANEVPELRKRYPDRRVVYLPNGVDPEVFRRKSPVRLREKLGIPQSRKILLCVSRMDYQKNQKMLLPLLSQILSHGEDVQLLLIGPVTVASYCAEFERQARELGLSDRVTLIRGTEPGGELLRAAYQQSDAMALPSRHEPFGIVALEAWSAGLPVIASAVGGLKYLFADGKTGFLCRPDSVEDFFAAWNALKNNEIRAEVIAGAARAVEEYSWTRIGARLAGLYEEVCHDYGK